MRNKTKPDLLEDQFWQATINVTPRNGAKPFVLQMLHLPERRRDVAVQHAMRILRRAYPNSDLECLGVGMKEAGPWDRAQKERPMAVKAIQKKAPKRIEEEPEDDVEEEDDDEDEDDEDETETDEEESEDEDEEESEDEDDEEEEEEEAPAPKAKAKGKEKGKTKKAPPTRATGATTGLSTADGWYHILDKNRKAKLNDAQIAAWMRKEFPGNKAYTENDVVAHRGYFNKGRFSSQNGVAPATLLKQYGATEEAPAKKAKKA